jgi:RimJ/RimL family protein N-acetyltransferase
MPLNEFGQDIGAPVPGWSARKPPPRTPMTGRFCRVEPLNPGLHAADLCAAFCSAGADRNWTYLPYGPFASAADFRSWLEQSALSDDPLFHAIVDRESNAAVGLAAYLRIDRAMGVIEVGHLNFSQRLQRRPAATEAMYLMMRRAFDELGYRRYEWKCDALNAPSCAAAGRLGFHFEGVFRQAVLVKGRNRDTAWFSIIDSQFPALQARFEAWLAAENFAPNGTQRQRLATIAAG